ncbi:MAG: AarF/UbiB family protein [Planctomycetota bacterium]|nr:AarF/UbiB family protein [Planctomycetota bacterium]MDA0934285.1 AarF/UbiB family protein [Planctomycetota bacterium]
MTTHLGLGPTLRTTKRARDILAVLVRYGFADLAEDLGMRRAWSFVRRLLHRPPMPDPAPEEVRIRRMLEELGPTFVKLGQVLSTRPDLVSETWCEEFRKLQSEAPSVPFEAMEVELRRELGERLDTLLASVDPEPIAAASIAQVHRAVRADGQRIVLKVLRPGVRGTIEADVRLMRRLAVLAERRLSSIGFSPVEVVDQFARHIAAETDLMLEGRNAERLSRAFGDDPRIGFPAVHWDLTTQSVLALEEIEGALLARHRPADFPIEVRNETVARCADAVFRQCFELGFFHADPHPGNIVLRTDGSICFLDCGMVGHVSPDTAEQLADLIRGTLHKDLDLVVRTAVGLADAAPEFQHDRQLRAWVWEFFGEFEGKSLAELRVGELLQDFFALVRRSGLRVAADLVYLIKAIATVEGVALELAPDFDLVAHVQPRVEGLIRRRYGVRAVRRRIEDGLLGYAEILETLPTQLRELFDRASRRHLTLNVDHRGLEDLTRQVSSASVNISYALLVGALIVGSSVLLLADAIGGRTSWITTLGITGFVSSVLIAGWRVLRLWLGPR